MGQVVSLTVDGLPGSADPAEQRRRAGIDAGAIVRAATEMLGTG
jgi:hypothetical protein